MNLIEQKLENLLDSHLEIAEDGCTIEDAQVIECLSNALANLRKAAAQQRNAENIEVTLKTFSDLGESFKQAAHGLDPEILKQMQNQIK